VLRYREWVRLGAGVAVSASVIREDGTPPQEITEARRVGPLSVGAAFVDVPPIDMTGLLTGATSFKIRFRVESVGATSERGFYLDDLDVAIEGP
jgi:hypothetical protein